MTNIFEKIQEFYPGMRCQFKEDWHNYYAGNIVIVAKVVKNVYPGGVHKIVFDDGYVISSSTAQEVLAIQHLHFISSEMVENEDRLMDLRKAFADAMERPMLMQDIFGEFAKDMKPDTGRAMAVSKAIDSREERNKFLMTYERAIFSFINKYATEEMTRICQSSVVIWKEELFEIDITLRGVAVNGKQIFTISDTSVKKTNCDDEITKCIQRAFEAELNAAGISCSEQGFGWRQKAE